MKGNYLRYLHILDCCIYLACFIDNVLATLCTGLLQVFLIDDLKFPEVGWLFGFYGISTFVGYLMPNLFLYK